MLSSILTSSGCTTKSSEKISFTTTKRVQWKLAVHDKWMEQNRKERESIAKRDRVVYECLWWFSKGPCTFYACQMDINTGRWIAWIYIVVTLQNHLNSCSRTRAPYTWVRVSNEDDLWLNRHTHVTGNRLVFFRVLLGPWLFFGWAFLSVVHALSVTEASWVSGWRFTLEVDIVSQSMLYET